MTIFGTDGDDDLTGTGGADDFDVSQGGQDVIHAKSGDDTIRFRATFGSGDFVDGAGGNDTILLRGNYSSGLDINSFLIKAVEAFELSRGFDYNLVFEDSAVAAGAHMTIDGSRIGVHQLSVDATGEHNAGFTIIGGAGDDFLLAGQSNDIVSGGGGRDIISAGFGTDVLNGGQGDDIFSFIDNMLGSDDRIDGGDGMDVVDLSSAITFTFTHDMMKNVETIALFNAAGTYVLDINDLNAPKHTPFAVDGSETTTGVEIDASALRRYHSLSLLGGSFHDVLTAGSRADLLIGGAGADTMDGGAGGDTFLYESLFQSTGATFDTIVGFDTHFDIISPLFAAGITVDAIDPMVKGGSLSLETFDDDLADAIGTAQLDDGDAVLFKPRHGGLAGELFVIVDANGTAGYQVGGDLVIHLEDPRHIADLAKANFSPPG